MILLSASELEKHFGTEEVLENVSFHISKGDRVGIVGDNGAGKTTLLSILSVPEGDDKPLKYPLMYQVCGLVIVNKIDVMPYFDFDLEACKGYIAKRNPKADVIAVSAKTGEGIDAVCDWIRKEVKAWKETE